MKEIPIIFSAPMVRAILAGNKTQTRRVIKDTDINPYDKYPPGSILWVRETWNDDWCDKVIYKADGGSAVEAGYPREPRWKPSIHMPRKYCRIYLEITDVRIERLSHISLEDVRKEGVTGGVLDFEDLWNSINEERGYGFETNPLVYVISFELIDNKYERMHNE